MASSDTISLLDADGLLIDQYTWTSSLSSTQQWTRLKLTSTPDIYLDNNTANDWQKAIYIDLPVSQVEYYIPEQVPEEPVEPDVPAEVTDPSFNPLPAVITELLPNAVGSDTGNEFIEVFNPNEEADVSLSGYQLAVGASLEKVITLSGYILKAGEYRSFTNAELGYTLLNTSSRVSLTTNNGIISSEAPAYDSAKEGESWALIDAIWQYTNQPTPGAKNLSSFIDDDESGGISAAILAIKPCAANQYRSTETNRCRLISSSASTAPTPCKVGQERSVETNRCRNIQTASITALCKEGQERSAETNRCRTVKKLSTASFGVKGATTKQSGTGWYVWAAISGVVLLVVGYAIWEWHDEIRKACKFMKEKFAAKVN